MGPEPAGSVFINNQQQSSFMSKKKLKHSDQTQQETETEEKRFGFLGEDLGPEPLINNAPVNR